MIKMVIFCVIAFALTWLPFNALIIIGDVSPDIWERADIMYIWFITHYLAMCHTITNPLIYIWMNNRFRAGFKQVIEDLYRPLKQVATYMCCYCLCFAWLFDCSEKRYSRVALTNRKRCLAQSRGRQLTSSTSANLNNHPRALDYHKDSAYSSNQKNANRTVSSGPILATSTNQANEAQDLIVAIKGFQPHNGGSSALSLGESSFMGANKGETQRNMPTSTKTRSSNDDKKPQPSIAVNSEASTSGLGLSTSVSAKDLNFSNKVVRSIRHMKMFGLRTPGGGGGESQYKSAAKSEIVAKKKSRHKKKESHGISIRMTTIEFRPNLKLADQPIRELTSPRSTTCDGVDEQHKNCTKKARWSCTRTVAPKQRCPACRLEASGNVLGKNLKNKRLDKLEKEGGFVIDMRRASQSTATSMQTNVTSLAMSSLNSTRGDNNNNTSASSSSGGGGGGGKVLLAQRAMEYLSSEDKANKTKQIDCELKEISNQRAIRSGSRSAILIKPGSSITSSSNLKCSVRSMDELPYLDETNSSLSRIPDGNHPDQVTANSISLMSEQANNSASSLEESSNGKMANNYCDKHRCSSNHQRNSIANFYDLTNQDDNHETDDDVFDVFLRNKDNQQHSKSIGSLEFTQDRYNHEQDRDLIAEYDDVNDDDDHGVDYNDDDDDDDDGVEYPTNRLECFELSLLRKVNGEQVRKSRCIQTRLPLKHAMIDESSLKRKFKSTSDDLFCNRCKPEVAISDAHSTVPNDNLYRRHTNGVRPSQRANLEQHHPDKVMIARVEKPYTGVSQAATANQQHHHLCSPRSRSLRRAMLLNNHLLLSSSTSSSNTGKILSGSIKDMEPSYGNKSAPATNLRESKTINEEWQEKAPLNREEFPSSSSNRASVEAGETCNSSPVSFHNHSSVAQTNQSSSSAPASMTNAIKPVSGSKEWSRENGYHERVRNCHKPPNLTNGGSLDLGQVNGTTIRKTAQVDVCSSSNVCRVECLSSMEGGHKASALCQVLNSKTNQSNEDGWMRDDDEHLIDNGKNCLVLRKSPTIYVMNKPTQVTTSSDSLEAIV